MDAHLILVGGGLANCLIALKLTASKPETQLLLLEKDAALGGNHTWSFHSSDVSAAQLGELRALIEQSWPKHYVRFPKLNRTLGGGYHSIVAERLDAVVRAKLGTQVICNARVARITAGSVELADGRRFEAAAVIDGRGDPGNEALWVCYQKFLGRFIELHEAHGLDAPLLMDATVEQRDGYRFMYVLPFSPTRLLVEDTYYSESPDLQREDLRRAIDEYASSAGWKIQRIEREEEGVLPVVLGGDIKAFWQDDPGVPRSGARAGLFNYTTGYSLPEAVRCAEQIAAAPELSSAELYRQLRGRSETLWRKGRFLRLLNRMLFLAGAPTERYRVLQHFYRLPEATVSRVYAGRSNALDRFRILSGRPPVPVGAALRAMLATRQEARQ